jgi:transposase
MFMSIVVVLLCGGCGAVRQHLDATEVVRAIQLLEDGVRQVEVARRLGVSQSVVSRLYQHFQETGLYHDRPRSRRPCALTDHQDRYVRTNDRQNRLDSARTLRNNLQNATGVHVSVQTVRNRLHADALNARRLAVTPRLTPTHCLCQARLAFSRAHGDWNIEAWLCVLFSDESRFCVSTNDRRQRVWRTCGQRFAECAIVEHDHFGGPSVMVWAGISIGGRTDLHVFQQGGINARMYWDHIILPILCAYAGAVGPDFLLMDDNAPIH